jgi:peroxiredoxin Q/BCP
MHIRPGALAPQFSTQEVFGHTINLADYRGCTVLLSFFRNATCALCNLRLHHMIMRNPHYARRGLAVIAVFESPYAQMRASLAKQDAPFPLIADPEAFLYDLYGVETSEPKVMRTLAMLETLAAVQEAAAHGFFLKEEPGSNFHRMPADFLIGPDGIVLEAHYSAYVMDHLPFDVIEHHLGLSVSA